MYIHIRVYTYVRMQIWYPRCAINSAVIYTFGVYTRHFYEDSHGTRFSIIPWEDKPAPATRSVNLKTAAEASEKTRHDHSASREGKKTRKRIVSGFEERITKLREIFFFGGAEFSAL